jgi:hypothetical protein
MASAASGFTECAPTGASITEGHCVPGAGAGMRPRAPMSKSSCLLRFQKPCLQAYKSKLGLAEVDNVQCRDGEKVQGQKDGDLIGPNAAAQIDSALSRQHGDIAVGQHVGAMADAAIKSDPPVRKKPRRASALPWPPRADWFKPGPFTYGGGASAASAATRPTKM